MESTRPSFGTKEEFKNWCLAPTTEHIFVSAVEGLQPAVRVSEVNPAHRMSGLVLDYDALPPGPPAIIVLANAPADLRPAYVSRSYSGHVRVFYRFEEPVPLFTNDVAKEFLKKVQRELKLKKLLPGFEEAAFLDLAKHYEIGDDMTPVGEGTAIIPKSLLMAWLEDACRKHRWDKEGPTIPIDAIRVEAAKRFGPDGWPGGWGKFDVGARGPRFWDESATDMTAVIVRESGCQFFSEGGGWMSWEAIFGSDFVRRWRDDRRGAAIANLFFDGKNYWRKLPSGDWDDPTRSDIALDLRVGKHLSERKPHANANTEIDEALYAIQTMNKVKAAMPFLFRPDGPHFYNNKRYLNVSTVKPILPVADHCEWGEGFPWLAQFLYTLFDPDDQLDYFLAWLKHFYMGAVTEDPRRGLALFIAGPVGAGKTLLNKAIIGQLMGGRQDAGAFLLGGDRFNDSLFGAALWNIDDDIVPSDPRQHAAFSQMVKRIVANDSFTYRAMYHSGEDMEWIGRIVVTMNDDPESLRMLPETEINILDKIMLLKTKAPNVDNWPNDAEIAAELPFFGAFLRDWVVPDHCKPAANKSRFGVNPYKHHDLVKAAASTSRTSAFEDLLTLWREDYFENSTDTHFEGNTTKLYQSIALNESLKSLLDRLVPSQQHIGTHLNKLILRGVGYVQRTGDRTFRINRVENN